MTSVYRLSEDKRQISLVQKATLTTEEFGIEPTHGLFGSTEWWSNIASGFLAVHRVRGVIERVFMGSMNDWPMCTVLEENGTRSNWTREMLDPSFDRFYRSGAQIEIDYVDQSSRLAGWSAGAIRKNVIEIRIESLDEK
jgi:hypothetical protein